MYANPRARSLFVVTVLAVVVIGGIVWQNLPDPGVREFQSAQEALKNVKSWRFKEVERSTYFTQEKTNDVSCPASQHGFSQSLKYDGTASSQYETYFVGGKGYVYNSVMKSWEERTDWTGPEGICTRLGLGLDSQPFPQFARLLKVAVISKREMKTVDGVECRVWFAKVPIMGGFNESEEVCIDPKTHLPAERKSHYSPGVYLFSKWNEEFEIRVPTGPFAGFPK